MRKPNFRKAVRDNKCSGRMFAQAYPRPSGIKNYFYFDYCSSCEGVTVVHRSTNLCEYCTENPGATVPKALFELGTSVTYSPMGIIATVAGSKYVRRYCGLGWVYKLKSKSLVEPIEVEEAWLKPLLSPT